MILPVKVGMNVSGRRVDPPSPHPRLDKRSMRTIAGSRCCAPDAESDCALIRLPSGGHLTPKFTSLKTRYGMKPVGAMAKHPSPRHRESLWNDGTDKAA